MKASISTAVSWTMVVFLLSLRLFTNAEALSGHEAIAGSMATKDGATTSKSDHPLQQTPDSANPRNQGRPPEGNAFSHNHQRYKRGNDDHHQLPHQKHTHHHPTKSSNVPKLAFRKNGRIYMVSQQDWYTEYRRHHAGVGVASVGTIHGGSPRSVMRKLHLESPHRKKARFSTNPDGSGEDDDVEEEGTNSGQNRGNSSSEAQTKAEKEQDGDEDSSSEGQRQGAKRRGSRKRLQAEQAVKRPKYVGAPVPVSVRHSGLIPKANSGAGPGRGRSGEGTWSSMWSRSLVLAMIGTIAGIV